MIINHHTLLRLPVFTASGAKLGYIIDIEIDLENHGIRKYAVGHKLFTKNIYLVSPLQIKHIDAKKIIVEDGVLKISATEKNSPAKIKPASDTV